MDDQRPVEPPAAAEPLVPGVSRRRLFGMLGAGVVVGAGAVAVADVALASDKKPATSASSRIVAFHGDHQAGITTPAQDRLHFAAFDLSPGVTKAQLVAMLKLWTKAAESMCAGQEVGPGGASNGPPAAPPTDTGEASGLPASQLTLTIGF